MRIIIITNLYPNLLEPNRATFNRSQFRELAQYCDLKIIAPIAWTDRLANWANKKGSIPQQEFIDTIEVFHPTYFFPPKVFRPIYGLCYWLSIFGTFTKINKKFNADVIFATWAFPDAYAAAIISKRSKLPLITKIHGSDIHSIKGSLRGRFTTWALDNSGKVVSVSNDLANQVHKMGISPNKTMTLYNGVDEQIFAPSNKRKARLQLNIHSDNKILLYVGNLKKVKGADLLADTIAILRSTHSNIHLYIIGQGVLKSHIEKQLNVLNITSSVSFLGMLSQEQISSWMNAADLLVIPSRNEGVPNVMLEAMSCGLPVVATKVGGIPEIIRQGVTGTLCEAPISKLLAEALANSLETKWNPSSIIEIAGQYTWKNNTKRLLEQFEAISKELN